MTLQVERLEIAAAPAMIAYQDDPSQAARKGTVLFYHGATASIEANRKELVALAERGFLAIGFDNCGHGERKTPETDLNLPNPAWFELFLSLVSETAAEVPQIYDDLLERGWIYEGRVGVSGISMGGFISYEALLREPRLRAAAVFVTTPKQVSSPADLRRFHPRAILTQTGGKDDLIDHEEAVRFHQALARYYKETPERNVHIHYPNSPHMMLAEDWDLAFERSLLWFERFLG